MGECEDLARAAPTKSIFGLQARSLPSLSVSVHHSFVVFFLLAFFIFIFFHSLPLVCLLTPLLLCFSFVDGMEQGALGCP